LWSNDPHQQLGAAEGEGEAKEYGDEFEEQLFHRS